MPRASKQSTSRLRVLYLVHNHPQHAKGGTEILSHALFVSMSRYAESYYLAASVGGLPGEMPLLHALEAKNNEWIYPAPAFDFFTQSTRQPAALHEALTPFLKKLAPDIVHIHHTLRFGMDIIRLVRDTLPAAKIMYSLHDYLPICHRDGMMVKTDGRLCEGASVAACNTCFPDISEKLFAMREGMIKTYFTLVDHFIAPSHFLAQRYREWGINAQQISVIANGHLVKQEAGKPSQAVAKKTQPPTRFAYFGQISPYKGVMTLLQAAALLKNKGSKAAQLHIFGQVGQQSAEFLAQWQAAVESLPPNVTFHGAYTPQQLPALMQQVDWVMVPSHWWENAPLVIDEAFQHKKPVLCSGIGGMAEKVTHERNGMHLPVADAAAWAKMMDTLSGDTAMHNKLVQGITPPQGQEQMTRLHLALYEKLHSQ